MWLGTNFLALSRFLAGKNQAFALQGLLKALAGIRRELRRNVRQQVSLGPACAQLNFQRPAARGRFGAEIVRHQREPPLSLPAQSDTAQLNVLICDSVFHARVLKNPAGSPRPDRLQVIRLAFF